MVILKQQVSDKRRELGMLAMAVALFMLTNPLEFVIKGCQSALNSFQVTASKSFHLVGPQALTDCLVYAGKDAPGWGAPDERRQSRPKPFGNSTA